ncbi:unnamed protein product [Sphenostylis stenocarpa]|uniref:Uncharacterized protein n=1 Tax=Sphenostylis stenocarpa TaxID=92480 RepID=A0AA86VCB0_9FABA|nr:unnamed protein product [Sphenostylis stenocarpa]
MIEYFNSHARESRVIVEKLRSKKGIFKIYISWTTEKIIVRFENSSASSRVHISLEIGGGFVRGVLEINLIDEVVEVDALGLNLPKKMQIERVWFGPLCVDVLKAVGGVLIPATFFSLLVKASLKSETSNVNKIFDNINSAECTLKLGLEQRSIGGGGGGSQKGVVMIVKEEGRHILYDNGVNNGRCTYTVFV